MPAVTASVVALLVAGTVPVGFVTYQIYYFAYARPRGLIFSFVHMDVALEVHQSGTAVSSVTNDGTWVVKLSKGLHLGFPFHRRIPGSRWIVSTAWLYRSDPNHSPGERTAGDIPLAERKDLPLGSARAHPELKWHRFRRISESKAVLREHTERRELNWLALETALGDHLRLRGDSERNFVDIDRLADIFHTLGAAKTALSIGWLGGTALVAVQLMINHALWTRAGLIGLVAALVALLPIAALYRALHGNRGHCNRRRIALIKAVLDSADAPAASQAPIELKARITIA